MRALLLIVLAACAEVAAAAQCSSLASMRWLLGDWLADGQKSTWRETWTEVGPHSWEGQGIETPKADPARASTEELRLVEMGDGVFYVAKVRRNELPVAFRLVECDESRLVFTNPAHDFPRRLAYERQPDGGLQVRVSDGADTGFTLDFARQSPTNADAAAVLAAEDARFAAMVAADVAGMRRWLAEDLRYVHSTGKVENRDELIAGIAAGKLRYIALTPGERQVRFLGPSAAVVEGSARIQAAAGAATADFQSRYVAVYALDGASWRLRAWQSLRLP
jgi:hypothetical protein